MAPTPPPTDDEDGYKVCPSDNLPARLVGDWSEDKHYYLKHYIDIFSAGMHKKWPTRVFVDLFSGPGMCCSRESGKFFDGSPLLALKAAHPFTDYHFSELDPTASQALKKRCAQFKDKGTINLYSGDCNSVAAKIAAKVPANALSLAFIDPTGLDISLSAIADLTKGKRMDLIILFASGMSIKRNIDKWGAKAESAKMDSFFGGTDWRPIYEKNKADFPGMTKDLLALYALKLKKLGYMMEPDQAIQVKNSRNLPLYVLLFASKDRLGLDFWRKGMKIEPNQQRGLPFDLP